MGAIPAVPGTPDNLGLGQAACGGWGGGCCELPCAGDLPLWCVGDGPQRHVSACGTLAWEQEQRVLAMDELWPSLRVHESRGAWVCEDEGPESEGHATWWWRLKVCGTAGVHA